MRSSRACACVRLDGLMVADGLMSSRLLARRLASWCAWWQLLLAKTGKLTAPQVPAYMVDGLVVVKRG